MKKINRLTTGLVTAGVAVMTLAGGTLPFAVKYADYALTARAEDISVDGVNYIIYSNHAEVKGYDKKTKNIVIPDEIEGVPVTSINEGAFRENLYMISSSPVESIVMGDNVKSIGEEAFLGCTKLKTIKMGKSVSAIGKNAFEECYSLESIEIPNGVKKLNGGTFYDCKSLKSVKLPSGLKGTSKNLLKSKWKGGIIKV